MGRIQNSEQILEIFSNKHSRNSINTAILTEELPPEVLAHGVVVADEDVPADRLAPGQRLRRRQRLEPPVAVPALLLLAAAVLGALLVALPAVGVARRPPRGRGLVEVALHLPAVAVISVVVAGVAPHHLVESKAADVVLAISAAGVAVVGVVLLYRSALLAPKASLPGPMSPLGSLKLTLLVFLAEASFGALRRPDGVAEGERGRLQAQLVAEVPELAVVALPLASVPLLSGLFLFC
jgi:hypothetical protein